MGGGGGESKSETTYAPAAAYMPQSTLDAVTSYTKMPTSMDISYGGQFFGMPLYAPLKAAQLQTQMYSPQPVSQTMTQETAPQMQGCGSCFVFAEVECDKKLVELR